MDQSEPIKVSIDKKVIESILQEHSRYGSNVEVGGVLLGNYKKEQTSGTRSISISEILPLDRSTIGFDWETSKERWIWASKKADELSLATLGWYHTHLGQGVFMSEMDKQVHKIYFDQESSVALVVDALSRTWGIFGWLKGEIVPITPVQINTKENHAESRLGSIEIVLETTMNSNTWDITLPRDVHIKAILAKILREPTLAIDEFDEQGNTIKYRVLWKEGNRELWDSETLRAIGIVDGQTLIIDNLQRGTALNLMRPLRVFLCHAIDDKPIIRSLYKRLTIENLDIWLDEEKLLPGQDWEFEIEKAVAACDIVLVCLSRSSINKAGYVQKEIKQALDIADKQPEGTLYIIPLKLEECDVPHRLRRWQWLNLFEIDGYEKLMRAFLERAITLRIRA